MEIDQRQQTKRDARALAELTRPISGSLLIARVLAVISALLAVVPYIALVQIGAELIAASTAARDVDDGEVGRWLTILLWSFGLRLFIFFIALLIGHIADIRLGHIVRLQMARRFARAPLSWFTKANSGRVRKALQDDIVTIHQLIAHQPVEGTSAIVMPLGLMIYAFVIDWRLGLLSIATIPLYVAATLLSMSMMGEKTVEMDRRLGTVSARMVEFVTGITVVKAFGRVGRAHRSYQQAADEFYVFYLDWVRPLIRISGIGYSVLAVPVILFVTVGGGAWLVNRGAVGAADVLTVALIALLIPYALEQFMNSSWSRQLAGAAASRVSDLLKTPILASDDDRDRVAPSSHAVSFEQVSYSYSGGDDDAVTDVSFELEQGTVTALVGPSGSGKSTIATLLARFDDPRAGSIRIGGIPIDEIADIYKHVGFVLQDAQLLSISIRDNIALGRPDATDDEIRAAARTAHVLTEIEALPNGFDTVYRSDVGLSGGQQQRIAIARALLTNAPILILDEATALIDPESQHEIQQALSALVRGRTVLVIGHRTESIAGVDQIVLLERGRVTATGTHEELLDRPAYARLWQRAEMMGGPR